LPEVSALFPVAETTAPNKFTQIECMDRDQFHGPLLVFDGDCGFCRAWVDYWKGLTSDRVNYAPFQEVGERFPQVSPEKFASAVKLILPSGEVSSGAHAVFTALASVPDRRWMLWSYDRFPGVAPLCEAAYRTIASRRSFGYWATRLLRGIHQARLSTRTCPHRCRRIPLRRQRNRSPVGGRRQHERAGVQDYGIRQSEEGCRRDFVSR
jgi:predicted DCC family thiol-disulfide oxidoreductase YuxK